jgi:ribonuclease HII
MAEQKHRLTITVDPRLAEAGQDAVAAGKADSMSRWVSDAIEEKIVRDRKLEHLAAAVADFEAQFGEITDDEIAAQQRADRAQATVVRGAARSA